MSNNMVPSIEALPVELLLRIFDNLDAETIVISIRLVCRLFRSIVNSYNRYVLDLSFTSKSNFYILCRLINPRDITSLTLFNDEQISNQIDLFISLVRLRQFTRLRSVTLINIEEGQLNFILKRINHNILTSFSFSIKKYDARRIKTTIALLSSAFASSTLHRLEVDLEPKRMSKTSWPTNCKIQYLTLNNSIDIDKFCIILQNCPHVHTLMINHIPTGMKNSSSICFPQVTSLTIKNRLVTINELESFLLLTPSLVYLRLLIGGKEMMDGKRWEQFIQINLLELDKFEFYLTEYTSFKQTARDVGLILALFQTPFWIEHKKWFVTCEYEKNNRDSLQLYSLPSRKSSVFYLSTSENISLSTYSMKMDNDIPIMDNIKSLTLTWNKSVANDIQEKPLGDFIQHICKPISFLAISSEFEEQDQNKTSNRPLFPKVTEIDLQFRDDWPLISLQSLSALIDVSQLTIMKVSSDILFYYDQNTWIDVSIFIKQAHNLSSLIIQSSFYRYESSQTIRNIHSVIPRRIKRLQIPINDLNQIKIIVERYENLSTINFNFEDTQFSKKIVNWFAENTISTTCREDYRSVVVWLGKKNIQSTEINHDNKRIKLTDHFSDA